MPREGAKVFENAFKAFFWIAAVAVALVFSVAMYRQQDESGSVPHTRTVDFYMTGDWLVGESRPCTLETSMADTKPLGLIHSVTCLASDREPELHHISVTFYGDLNPKDDDGKSRRLPVQWTCTRHSDGFSCKGW